MRKFNVPCPDVQIIKQHVLIMSFIGEDRVPAPKLKDAKFSTVDLTDAYEQVVAVSIQYNFFFIHNVSFYISIHFFFIHKFLPRKKVLLLNCIC